MVVEPNERQHPDIQKLNLTVKKLMDVTHEAMSTFFTDKETPGNSRKKPYLDEIFRVAQAEERYKANQIGGWCFRPFTVSLELTQKQTRAR